MIKVNTAFNPYRMMLSRKLPVNFTLELHNTYDEAAKLTVNVKLSNQLSLEKGGFKNEVTERIEELAPGAKQKFYYDIYQKAGTRVAEQPIAITVLEHYRDFSYVSKESKKYLGLKVEE